MSTHEGDRCGTAQNGTETEPLEIVGAAFKDGLGWGDPRAIAALRPGDVVVDIGSGAGFDSLLAASRVGRRGYVIGVDQRPEMLARARDNAGRAKATNVEFRLGGIEHLPVVDASVDAIISNSIVIPSRNKVAVFSEFSRVLKTGGRIVLTDLVTSGALPMDVAARVRDLTAGAATPIQATDIRGFMIEAGFEAIEIEPREDDLAIIGPYLPDAEEHLAAMRIEGTKAAPGLAWVIRRS